MKVRPLCCLRSVAMAVLSWTLGRLLQFRTHSHNLSFSWFVWLSFFCTAVMTRDKLAKASFPASLGKALAVSTHHRSRSQDLLCCKLKLETFQLNMCLWRSTCCDMIGVMKWKKLQQQSAWDQFPHLQISTFSTTATAQLLNRSRTGCSTCRSL